MISQKKYKVIVVGLPKTGTSTLAVMLRMLGYRVNGPDTNYKFGDYIHLDQQFELYDAFQDYPWCFEWYRYFDTPSLKFIILKRESESWWKSFYESYGTKNGYYLSNSYFEIEKNMDNKQKFLDFHESHYEKIDACAQEHPERFLLINILSFEWKELCDFLDEALPKNLLGLHVKKPHVNKEKSKVITKRRYKFTNSVKKKVIDIIGKDKWNQLSIFFRKNGFIK